MQINNQTPYRQNLSFSGVKLNMKSIRKHAPDLENKINKAMPLIKRFAASSGTKGTNLGIGAKTKSVNQAVLTLKTKTERIFPAFFRYLFGVRGKAKESKIIDKINSSAQIENSVENAIVRAQSDLHSKILGKCKTVQSKRTENARALREKSLSKLARDKQRTIISAEKSLAELWNF